MRYATAHQNPRHPGHHFLHVDRSTVRILLTMFMYVGVVLFLYPYATSHMSSGLFFLICGAVLTLSCGALRCYLTDGDCADRSQTKPAP